MNIEQIKTKIGIPSLQLQKSLDKENNYDGWLRHWENDTRTAVSVHEDTAKEIKADPKIAFLGLQKEVREAEQGTYTAYRIVKYTEPEMTL